MQKRAQKRVAKPQLTKALLQDALAAVQPEFDKMKEACEAAAKAVQCYNQVLEIALSDVLFKNLVEYDDVIEAIQEAAWHPEEPAAAALELICEALGICSLDIEALPTK